MKIQNGGHTYLKTSFNAILDYIRCPIVYLLKNVHQIPDPVERSDYNEAIKTCIKHIYYRLLDKMDVDEDLLKNKWEQLWFGDIKALDIISSEVKEQKVKQGYQGWQWIKQHYNSIASNPGIPLVINLDYEVVVGRHTITGVIDLAKEISPKPYHRHVEIVYYGITDHVPDEWELKNNIYLTMQSYAFRREFNMKEQKLDYQTLKNNKSHITQRGEEDYRKLGNLIDVVCTSMEANLFYPRITYMCKGCPYKTYCDGWGTK